MKLRRRRLAPVTPTAPPLDERTVLLLPLGRDKNDPHRGPFIQQLQITGRWFARDVRPLKAHREFLLSEAQRLNISRPAEGFTFEQRIAFLEEHVRADDDAAG